jgi:hypothetical protein
MKRICTVLLATVMFCAGAFAQKGNNFIGIGGDLSIPTGQFASYYRTGMGGYIKGLFGVGKSGQVTLTSGYSTFKEAVKDGDVTRTAAILPLLIGYRANFNRFFVEPQIGYALYPYKLSSPEDGFATATGNAFNWAAGIGYVFNSRIEVSARYQNGSNAGTTVGLFGLRIGYNIPLRASKK